jgi:hypothetical protein
MRSDQHTYRQGETYVLGEDFSTEDAYRPIVLRASGRKRGQRYRGNSGFNRSYDFRRRSPRFWNYKGYVPYWFQDLCESVWDKMKLIAITLIVSQVLSAYLPTVLRAFLQP